MCQILKRVKSSSTDLTNSFLSLYLSLSLSLSFSLPPSVSVTLCASVSRSISPYFPTLSLCLSCWNCFHLSLPLILNALSLFPPLFQYTLSLYFSLSNVVCFCLSISHSKLFLSPPLFWRGVKPEFLQTIIAPSWAVKPQSKAHFEHKESPLLCLDAQIYHGGGASHRDDSTTSSPVRNKEQIKMTTQRQPR